MHTILAKARKNIIRFGMANDNDRQRMLDRLQEHFSKVNPEDQSARWNKMWEEQTTPWDRKAPSEYCLSRALLQVDDRDQALHSLTR